MLRLLFTACLLTITSLGAAQAGKVPEIVWSTALNRPVFTAPQVAGGRLYLTSTNPSGPNVFALDGATGRVAWSYATQGMVMIPPTLSKSQLFVASDIGSTHYLRAINAKTGLLIWQYTRNQPPECMCSQASILSGGLLFAQSDGHSLYAFLPDGNAPSKRIWQFVGDGAPLSNPVMADGRVLFGSGDHYVYALDGKTGKTIWTATTGYVFTAAPLAEDGVAVIGDQGGNIDGFDLKTGKPLWSDAANAAIDDAAVADGNTAYFVSEDHSIYAINISSGNPVWQYTMDDYGEFSPLSAGNLIIAANRAGELLGIDAVSGKRIWQTNLDGTPLSPPIELASEHAVVLKVGDQSIAAYDMATGKLLWRYTGAAVLTPPVANGSDVDTITATGTAVALH